MLGILPHLSSAQSTSLNVRLADLSSDLNRLDQIVRSLRLEVEALRRENRQMQDWVEEQLAGSVDRPVSEERMNTVLREYERRIQAANRVSRESLVNEVSQEIETLAEQTQKAINALAKSVEGQPQLEQVIVFSDDYPGSGTSYTVKSGDSLGKIARTHGSKVDWIRNANRLSSDIIYPGQELFIPLEN
ncbi:MAG TPA: LysM peptidoglycan-binding domain-containing protein [Oceanipulchritudo sp.]|nr:LysM peptidoglycan-binding domain-containing protein [Oceanipulchritudo sp.]